MIQAALFDLDGLLVNSEELFLEANQTYFKRFNFDFTEEHHREGTGRKFEEWIKTIVQLDKSGEEIFAERNIIFFDLIQQKLKLVPGAKEILTLMHKNFKTALVTSARRNYVEKVFERTNIEKYFNYQVTGDMVSQGKPAPECYFLAAKQLHVKPRECLVFEDSPHGITAGKAAGMTVVAVPSRYVKGETIFSKADFVFDSLEEITLATLNLN